MITVQDIYNLIDGKAPFSSQMSFDNAGFLVGDRTAEVKKVLVSLDITEEVAQEAADRGCQLIVSHHPLIFHPLKSVTTDDAGGRTVRILVKNDISCICAHTNLDVAPGGVNDCLAEAVGLTDTGRLNTEGHYADGSPYGCGRVGILRDGPMTLKEFLPLVSQRLKPNGIRYTDAGKTVSRIAVGGGACADYMDDAIALGCDTFITSDVKYNGFLDAKDKGINLIDAGHYPTENVVCPRLIEWIRESFPGVEVMMTAVHREAFEYIV